MVNNQLMNPHREEDNLSMLNDLQAVNLSVTFGLPGWLGFIDAYFHCPSGSSLTAQVGTMTKLPGKPFLLMTIDRPSVDSFIAAFTADEARTYAQMCEDGMNLHPADPDVEILPNLILLLRDGADRVDAAMA